MLLATARTPILRYRLIPMVAFFRCSMQRPPERWRLKTELCCFTIIFIGRIQNSTGKC